SCTRITRMSSPRLRLRSPISRASSRTPRWAAFWVRSPHDSSVAVDIAPTSGPSPNAGGGEARLRNLLLSLPQHWGRAGSGPAFPRQSDRDLLRAGIHLDVVAEGIVEECRRHIHHALVHVGISGQAHRRAAHVHVAVRHTDRRRPLADRGGGDLV